MLRPALERMEKTRKIFELDPIFCEILEIFESLIEDSEKNATPDDYKFSVYFDFEENEGESYEFISLKEKLYNIFASMDFEMLKVYFYNLDAYLGTLGYTNDGLLCDNYEDYDEYDVEEILKCGFIGIYWDALM